MSAWLAENWYVLIDAAFAVALWAATWLNAGGSVNVRRWTAILAISWGLTGPTSYFNPPHFDGFCMTTDIALGIWAGLEFAFGKRQPLWLVALVVTYFVQLVCHADEGVAKWMELNGLFAIQILLVSGEQICHRLGVCLKPILRPLLYSHGALTRLDRSATRRMRGPDCRPLALRRALERANEI